MNFRKRKNTENKLSVQTVPKSSGENFDLFSQYEIQNYAQRELYSSLRESVPIIDAAISKIVRLIGDFTVSTSNALCQQKADYFIKNVISNGGAKGINSFLHSYIDSLLTFGEAVGEMVIGQNGVECLYNASLDDVVIKADNSPLKLKVLRVGSGGQTELKYPDLVLASLLNPQPGTVQGTSILKGLPFVSVILLKILKSIKTNWERVGDVRFAVTYNPSAGTVVTKETAQIIADEWKKAMRSENVCDFISSGDVNVRVIGAENNMPDCDVPMRAILEQILSKLGIPPFLLGISWSSTERMSEQQADILTSELDYYRSVITPIIEKIVEFHLRLNGYESDVFVEWSDINLQDAVEMSNARLNNAQAQQIEIQNEKEELSEQK